MSVPAYPEYKDSEVAWLGGVPSHWPVMPLRSQFIEHKQKNDGLQSTNYLSLVAGRGVMPYAEKGDIGNKQPDDLEKCKIVRAGNFVINSMNFGIGAFGISAYDGICSPVYVTLEPNEPRSRTFLRWIFDNPGFRNTAQSFGNGILSHRAAIGWEELKVMAAGIPPITEQKAIASFLDRETAKIDALVAEQERLITLLKEKRQAVISHAVIKGLNPNAPMKDSGIEWLGKIPAHWETRRLRFVADIETGDSDTANATEDGEYPFFVRSPHVERIDGYTHDGEAVMTAGDGAGVGKVFHHFNGKFRAHQRVYIFRNFRAVSGKWLYEYLKALFYRVVLEGTAKSTVDSLRRPMIADFPITIPSVKEIRPIEERISAKSYQFDQLVDQAQSAIALLQERRAALISAAVTGKIDVRGLVEAPRERELA